MPGFVFLDPNNFNNKYYTSSTSDSGIPAGYINSNGSDGTADRDMQIFKPGGASGGSPVYPDAVTKAQVIANLKNLNGSQSPNASNSPY